MAVQPGWFPGHSVAFIYVNIGIQGPGDLAPPNMSHNVVPPFQITGPNNNFYNGTFCLPQVPLPANTSLQVGQNITIQVVESAQHGAALYNVSRSHKHASGSADIEKNSVSMSNWLNPMIQTLYLSRPKTASIHQILGLISSSQHQV